MARQTKRIFNTTPEEIEKINPDNMQLIEEFLRYYAATDHSQKSCVVTKSNLLIFFVWVQKYLKNRHFATIRRKDYLQYQAFLVENELSPARIRALKSSISSLSIYVENMIVSELDPDYDEEEYKLWSKWKNCINSIKSPVNSVVRQKTILSEEQIQKLLDYLVERKQYQKACVLALAVSSGARKSELVQFETEFFDKKNIVFGSLYLTSKPIKTKGRGSNGKLLRKYVLISTFQKYLDLWLEERKRLNIDSKWLFVIKDGDDYKQMPTTTLDSYARSFSSFLGVDFYWHSSRHYLCTKLCESGISAEGVVQLFGWESQEMLKIYNDSYGVNTLAKYFSDGEIVKVEEKSLTSL